LVLYKLILTEKIIKFHKEYVDFKAQFAQIKLFIHRYDQIVR